MKLLNLIKPWKFLLITLLVISIFFRFANLDKKVFWFDETATLLKISGYTLELWDNKLPSHQLINVDNLPKYYLPNPESNAIDTIKLLAQQDSKHTPLYFFILRLWVDFFGNSVAVIRSLSAIFSLLAFPCIYWLCLELFQHPLVGWMGVALIAVSPFHILYAQEARMYSLQLVMILLSSAVLLRAIRINNKLNWGLYALSLSLSIYTHTLSLLVAVAHGIYVVAIYGVRQSKIFVAYLVATLISLLAFSPWLFFILTHSQQVSRSMAWSTKAIPLSSLMKHWAINLSRIFLDFNPNYYLDDFSSFNNPLSVFSILTLLIFVGYSINFLCRNSPKKTRTFILTLIIIPALVLVFPDLLFSGIRSFNNRYLVASYLGIHLAVAYLLAMKIVSSIKTWQQKFWQITMLVVIGFGIISCMTIYPTETWWNKYYSSESIPIAKIVNQANDPLLLLENYWFSEGNLYSLSQFLNSDVKLQILLKGKMMSKIPDSFSNVFLFNPSEALQEEMKKSKQYEIQPVYDGRRFLLFKLEK